jgi:hypothetical protein
VKPRSKLTKFAEQNLNLLLEGVPGTGKTFAFGKICEELGIAADRCFVLNCHPSTQYEDVIEGLRPQSLTALSEPWADLGGNPSPKDQNGWRVVDGVFLRACTVAARSKPGHKVAILLDELNRANVPRMMGDLLTVIERSKRGVFDGNGAFVGTLPSYAVTLPLSGRKFLVPANLIVVATMNTVDHSVSPLDQALLRRFWRVRLEPLGFETPVPTPIDQLAIDLELDTPQLKDAGRAYIALNNMLRDALGPDGMIGHSFLTEMRDMPRGPDHEAAVDNIWRYGVAPQVISAVLAAGRERWFAEGKGDDVNSVALKRALKECGKIVLEYDGEGGTKALRLKG